MANIITTDTAIRFKGSSVSKTSLQKVVDLNYGEAGVRVSGPSISIEILLTDTINGQSFSTMKELRDYVDENFFKGGSGPGTEASWGSITGDIEDQADLVNYIAENGGVKGDNGWSPKLVFEEDGATRLVKKLDSWIGGTGTAPTDNVGMYVADGGYTADKSLATNFKGAQGTATGIVEEGNTEAVSGDEVWKFSEVLKDDIRADFMNEPIKNILINSDFSNQNEESIWKQSFSGAFVNIDNGNLLIQGNGVNENPSTAGGSTTPLITGHKYYFKVVLKTNKPTSQFRCFVRGLSQTSTNGHIVNNPVVDEYYNLGKILTANSSPTIYGVSLGARFESPEGANGSVISVKNTMLIDLTLAYGAGNEPSLTDFEKIIGEIDNEWFDGSYDIYPNFKIVENVKSLLDREIPVKLLVNEFKNTDLKTTDSWVRGSGVSQSEVTVDTERNVIVFKPTNTSSNFGVLDQNIGLVDEGDKLFFAFEIKPLYLMPSTSGMYLRGGVQPATSYSGNMANTGKLGEWNYVSKIIEVPVDVTNNITFSVRNNYPTESDFNSAIMELRKPIYINLTEVFGKGNEPSISFMNQLVKNLPNQHFVYKMTLSDSLLRGIDTYSLEVSSVPYNDINCISQDKGVSPVLFGVKHRTKLGQQTAPYGWLYYVPYDNYDILYSSGNPYNPKKIFNWDFNIANGETPDKYSPIICKNGDIIFVFRGERSVENPRRNPIIYKFEDNYSTPQVIDFGISFKPHAWLQNCGMEYIYDEDIILFAEYTRPQSITANIWRVTAPFDNPDNWVVVKSFDIGDGVGEIEHLHTINYDPYNGYIYSTSGDWDSQSNILESQDNGTTWDIVSSGSAIVSRVLNFICQPEGLYYATDDSRHILYYVPRLTNGDVDWDAREILYDFRDKMEGAAVTYSTCLINEPKGLLILDRHDAITNLPLYIHFYDINKREMHIVRIFNPVGDIATRYGFRNDAVSFYPSINFNGVVTGFGYHANELNVLNNEVGNKRVTINNLVLKLNKKPASW